MGLKCSLLGHAYEPAGVERDREERGSEVVTVVREIERCHRCGAERVISESTEVTTVVEPEDVGLDGVDTDESAGGAFDGVVERSGAMDDVDAPDEADDTTPADESPDFEVEDRDPADEDAEILTDETGRAPGQWPDDPEGEPWEPTLDNDTDADETDADDDAVLDAADTDEIITELDDPAAGITVPEGRLDCPDCGFSVDAESSYRDGDPCPECGAWLRLERNR